MISRFKRWFREYRIRRRFEKDCRQPPLQHISALSRRGREDMVVVRYLPKQDRVRIRLYLNGKITGYRVLSREKFLHRHAEMQRKIEKAKKRKSENAYAS